MKSVIQKINFNILLLLAVFSAQFNIACARQFTPENTVFAFDLHDVVLKTDYTRAIKTGVNELPKLPALKLLANPWAISKMVETKKRYGVNEKFFEEMAGEYPEIADCKETILKLANYQNINAPMLKTIKELKQLGYKVYIFSNISTESLNYLKTNQPELMSLFDGVQNPNQENNFTRKPKSQAYLLFKEQLEKNGDQNKTVIFLDDNKNNIKTANNMGFIGIRYKSPEKFKSRLCRLGIKF